MSQRPTRCTEFWYSNRMIVIKVEDTILRVHVDVLARHSEVFRDLLALPQPADAESIDGTPVVRIEGTSVEDMRLLLGYMYNSAECVASCFARHRQTHERAGTDRRCPTILASRGSCDCPTSTSSPTSGST